LSKRIGGKRPLTAFEIAFRHACLLCEPDVCVLQGPRLVLIFSLSGSLLFALLIVGAVVAFLYYSSFNQWLRLREPLRLIEDGSVPHPPLAPGKRYHLFLSHCWFSGQDQCGVIKRRLRLLLPDCVTFLDVDDLESTSHLESHVRASASVLIFLSRCYFESHNCRREVLAAIENSIPLILVHEMQRDKSTPLAALRASCVACCGEHAVSSAVAWRKGLADGLAAFAAAHGGSLRAEDVEHLALPNMCRRADIIVQRLRAAASASSIPSKRRVNLALAPRRAASGSIFRCRARLAITNSRSPNSSSISPWLRVSRASTSSWASSTILSTT